MVEAVPQAPDAQAAPRDRPLDVLRLRDFRLYLAGNFVATIGQQMQSVAVGWELYERTHRPLALGLVGLAQMIPVVLLVLHAGHVADRYDRRRVAMIALAGFAVASLGLAAVSLARGPIWLVYACLFVGGVARSFYGAAKGAIIPQLVPRETLHRAVTWSSGSWQLASVLGPAFGGFALAHFHRAAPVYLVDVGACVLFLVALGLIRSRQASRTGEPPTTASLLAGVRFLTRNDVLLAAITLDMFAVLLGGATALLPVYAKDILHVGARELGWLVSAPAVGAVATALVLAFRPPFARAGRTLLIAVIGFGLATIGFGISRSLPLSLVMLLLTGAFDNVSVVIRSTLLQLMTPDEMRGRVASVNSLFIGTSNELGGFESGAAAQAFGPVAAVVAGGIGTIAVVLGVARVWPAIARLRNLQDAA